ncbi:transposase [Parvibaculum sp.]|uniref:transposase n=1 Tax=Parvibaculum sp. TaxID=2024848 RepID=UPI003BAD00DA
MYAVWLLRHLHAAGQLACPCGGAQFIGLKANQPVLRCYECKSTQTITNGDARQGGCFFSGLSGISPHGAMAFLFGFVTGANMHFAATLGAFAENSKQPRQLAKRFSELCVGANAREYHDNRDGCREMEADECAVAGRRKYNKGRRARKGGVVWVAGAARIHYGRVTQLVARVVANRTKEELGPLLLWLMENDGILRTDCWRGYMSLTKTAALHGKNIVHKTVNHSRTFKEADGTHTNRIEGMWRGPALGGEAPPGARWASAS